KVVRIGREGEAQRRRAAADPGDLAPDRPGATAAGAVVTATSSGDVAGAALVDLDPEPDAAEAKAVGGRGAQKEARVVAVGRELDLREGVLGVAVGRYATGRSSQGRGGERGCGQQHAQSHEAHWDLHPLACPSADPESYRSWEAPPFQLELTLVVDIEHREAVGDRGQSVNPLRGR